MSLRSFTIKEQKALRLAECKSVPPIMVVSGPNGVGKSTLLFAIKRRIGSIDCDGRVLYIPAHRITRPQRIQMTTLWEPERKLSEILMQDSVSGFPGIRVLDGSREQNGADEALSAVKYILNQFETRKQAAVNTMLERNGVVRSEDVGDIFAPVRALTRYVLPHLQFNRIDIGDRSNVRCLFMRTDRLAATEVDLDDLSSGERAVISLFMPFLEQQINRELRKIESVGGTGEAKFDDLIVLIDEPELHLHPLLQSRLLEYFRVLVRSENTQFVLVTHSPTLLAAADYSELYVLRPPVSETDNQLVQLADSSERLDAMRDLCGDTYILTSCRTIVCVEGESPSATSKAPTDVRILEMLCPELTSHVLVPLGGRGNAVETARRLREMLVANFPIVDVRALVDSDQGGNKDADWIHSLPVAMIENLLIVPEAIWSYLKPYHDRTQLNGLLDVERELRSIAASRRDREISLRVQREIRPETLRPQGHSVAKVRENLDAQISRFQERMSDAKLQDVLEHLGQEVDGIIESGDEFKFFHGKEMLKEFYDQHVHRIGGIGYETFVIEIARSIGANESFRRPILDALSPLFTGLGPSRGAA